MRALLACLVVLPVFGCGDENYYVNNPSRLGEGVCGQYFLAVRNTENTCGSGIEYNYLSLVERGNPVKEVFSVLTVTPLDAEEKDTRFQFLGYNMNGIGVAEDGTFELYLSDSYGADIYFNGRFFDNKVEIRFEFNVELKGRLPCRYVFEGLAEKYLDYKIPEAPQKDPSGQ